MSNESKLATLRAKTDRELLILIEHELDRALKLASTSGRYGSQVHVDGVETYRKALILLLKAGEVRGCQRVHIERQLKELRFRLDLAVMEEAARCPSLCGPLADGFAFQRAGDWTVPMDGV